MAYNVYSLPDCKSVLYHPDVGTANLHQCGMGKIVVSAAGDLTSHTTAADGYIVVNKLEDHQRDGHPGGAAEQHRGRFPAPVGQMGAQHCQPEPDCDDLRRRRRVHHRVHRGQIPYSIGLQ